MRYYPKEEYELKEAQELKAPEWMLDMLKKNPEYCSWGNYEDAMISNGFKIETVNDLWGLDELNELINFYFFIERENIGCDCGGTGWNQATKQLADDWYDFNQTGRKWCHNITDVEVRELVKEARLWDLTDKRYDFDKEKNIWKYSENGEWVELEGEPNFPTAAEVNKWSQKGMGHDAINRLICVRARAKSLGVYGNCKECDGRGHLFTEETPRLALQMWFIHPRKGRSNGVILKNIQHQEIPIVIDYLKEARERNYNRFGKL